MNAKQEDNTDNAHSNETVLREHPALRRLLEAAALANEATLREEADGTVQGKGDAVDVALLFMAAKAGLKQEQLLERYPECGRIAYESQQKYAASFHENDGGVRACVKGAVETLSDMSASQATGKKESGEKEGGKLDDEALKEQEQKLSRRQYRVLAFADGDAPDKDEYDENDLKELCFLGMTGMRDPLRREAKQAVADCRKAGIKVAMITGDHPQTAFAIARELELCGEQDEVITGKDISDAADDEAALDELTRRGTVYARVEPAQKLDIVRSLTRHGHFVAVTGDGVNDAPALNHAHVGVAMGDKGTDVARESAEIILTDDNFASIVAGVEEGRVAYNNIRKIIFFLISKGLSEVLLFMAAIAFGMGVPLFATQLLWLNFVTNGIQDIAHAFEPAEGSELKEKPRDPNEPIFDRLMIMRVGIAGLTIFLVSFAVFYVSQHHYGYGLEDARNLTLLQLVLFGNVIAINSRSEHQSFFAQPLFKNKLLLMSVIVAQLLHIGAMYTPWLSDVLYIQPVTLREWSVLLGLALSLMVVLEIEKAIRRRLARAD